ncbi:translocation/assembly module TamB domain-containing protein [uncultured Hyphomonas sp.]|uniref:translocation/assembly module TamB domain-containing protein n=1 Tax=uncultured Hyphomonas sp. TaxID=225298 RepID=UPI002AAB517D|nr:translocation/assembly module TamB domain-containing protein [uncultured Hyphomonas sp.]
MPALKTLLSPIRKRPWLSAAAALLLVIVIAVISARIWIASDGGRAWLLSQIDGRKAGAYGTIDAKGLSGDPLGKMYLRRLAVRDAKGDWVVAQNVTVDWAPMALVSGLVDVKALSAGELNFIRRPVTEKQPPSSGGGGSIRIKLRSLTIPDLAFQEGFAGPEAHFNVSGRYDQDGRTLAARLDASPRDTGNDRFLIDLRRNATGPFSLDADINGAPGGVIANLIGLETGTGVTLKASASGTPETASGEATLTIGDQPAATARLKIKDKRLTADAELNATRLPMLSGQVVSLVGETASVRLESTTGLREAPFGVETSLRAGKLSVRGTVDTRSWSLTEAAGLDVEVTDLQPVLGEPGKLSFIGTAAKDRKDWLLQGKAALKVSGENALPFEGAEGPVKISIGQPDIAFTGDLKIARLLGRVSAAAPLFGDTTALHTEGRYDRTTQRIILDKTGAALSSGRVGVTGTVDLADRTLDLSGTLATALDPLPGGARGQLSGPFSVTGALTRPAVDFSLAAKNLAGLPDPLVQLTGTAPTLKASLQVKTGALGISSARLAGQRAVVTAAGNWAWSGNSDVRASLTQSAPVTAGGWEVTLGHALVQLGGRSGALRYDIVTSGGSATGAGRQVDDLALTANLTDARGRISGPLSLHATADGEPVSADANLIRTDGTTQIADLTGALGPGTFTGAVTLADSGDLTGDINVDGTAISWGSGEAREAKGTLHFERQGEDPFALMADLTVTDLALGPGRALVFDKASATLRNAPEGYDIRARLISEVPSYPTDLTFIASASFDAPAPTGMFELSGTALGEPINTAAPAHWRLGETPELDADISLLSGRIKAGLTGGGDDTRLIFDATGIDLSPVLALFETTTNRTRMEGHGDLRVFGADPSGMIHIVAASDVPGLDSSFMMNLDGTLTPGGLSVDLKSDYGGRLVLKGSTDIPVTAEAGQLVALDRTAPLTGEASLTGDLAVLRTAALAYGHDVSGTIDASASLSGTLEAPAYKARAGLRDGTYELGSMGFQLSGITADADYDGSALSVTGKAGAPGGGTFALEGRLARDSADLEAEFRNLLLFNRDGDNARGSGKLVLADRADARSLTGEVTITQARYSIDNLPSSRPHAIDVRWTDDPPSGPETSQLRRTLTLDIAINAERRVYVTGRGLDSEWRADLKLTGTPAAPRLNGTTTLIRGDLDLAGRPFVFDTGTISFDGAINRARINLSAERSVNDFDVQVNVTGSPVKPAIELSSSPDLPQDEILSRLLFGRSSMDLSALEAAQLANTIARLSGNSTGFDPASEFQAALGIDRFSIGTSESGSAEIGVGQYLSDDVYLELKSAGAEGSSVEVEWQPRPQVSVTSETSATGDSKVSIRWKKDY